jgi:hypothetical protein
MKIQIFALTENQNPEENDCNFYADFALSTTHPCRYSVIISFT